MGIAGCGVMVGVVAICFALSYVVGGSGAQAVPYKVIDIPYGPITISEGSVYKQLPGAQYERSQMMTDVMGRCLPPLSARAQANLGRDPAFGGRLGRVAVYGFGRYLTCSMRGERHRFCESPEHRGELITELIAYFRVADAFLKGWEKHIGPNRKHSPIEEWGMQMTLKSRRRDMSAQQRRPNLPSPDVVKVMQKLYADGYLKRTDFGWWMPREIKKYLKDVEVTRQACG
ncbi:MAG: hypothetical protein AAFV69_10320 [Pseudomonadota bacterium]